MSQELNDASGYESSGFSQSGSAFSQSGTSHSIVARSRSLLADLFMRMRPHLKWVARQQTQRLPNCKDDESDIVQQSMIKAIEHVDQLRGKDTGQWRAWIVKIVRNQAKDVRRYWQQDKRALDHEDRNSHVVVGLIDKNNVTPSKIMDAEEHQQLVDTALASLTIQDQQLVRWRIFQYATYREIAERLKVTEPTARRRCNVAKAAFREALERLGA